jgi:FkbM family methyltransferase
MWKGRAVAFAAQLREATARRSAARQELRQAQQARRQAQEARRQALRQRLSAKVARSTFIHRTRTLAARVDARSAGEREARFVRVSAPFRRALESTSETPDPMAQQLHIDGITWWVPANAIKGAVGLRLPHPGILQTREVTIGGIMLDLGANIGRMSIPRVIYGDATVAYCAEPDPVNFACLARSVIDNGLRGLVLPDQTAIGDHDGVVRLLGTGRSGDYCVVPDTSADTEHTIDVPCATLDTWVERLRIDLDAVTFIKVDVEGFERRVVAGARRVLQRSHIAWQMEIKPAGLRSVGDDPQELYADLRQAFTHFIDLNRQAPGRRVRPIAELSDALQYIEPRRKTDVLLFSGT